MRGNKRHGRSSRLFLLGTLLMAMVAATTGCQVDVGGQTLPSPYHLSDDVQYFPAGAEYILTREAAEMAQSAEARAPIR